MPFEAELYPPDWHKMREAKIKQANGCCESCGVKDRAILESTKTRKPYMVHLQLAHKNQYETWKKDAETMVLCPRCHRRYDRQFRRKGGSRSYAPLGYASVYTDYQGRNVLVEQAKTLDELRDVLSALPTPSDIEIHLYMIFAVVGNGFYRKEQGELIALAEYGVCMGLRPLL